MNTHIKAAIVSLQELVFVQQITRGQYDYAKVMVLNLKNQVEQEYAGITSQLETMILSGTSTDEERALVAAKMKFQADIGPKVKTIHTTLVRNMPPPEPALQPAVTVRLGGAQ